MKRLTIIDFVEKYTRQYSELTFLREKVDGVWTETTFRETREEAYKIGAGLIRLGMKKGDKASLLSQGRNLWITSELGILYAGGVNVPLSIKLTESTDLLFRIQHSDSRFVIVSEQQLSKIRSIISDCPKVEKIIVLDPIEDYQKNEIPISEVIAMGEEYLKEHAEDFRAVYESIQPDDYANISYTSGTTADPKGILLTHRNYTSNVEQARTLVNIDETWRTLIILPLDHCFAHVVGFYIMMSRGATAATVQVGRTGLETLKNIPLNIKEVRPHFILSVPSLAKTFKKNIEGAIHAKGKVTETLFNWGISVRQKYYGDSNLDSKGMRIFLKPLVALFDKLIFSKVRENFGGELRFFVGGGALLDKELQNFYIGVGMPMFQGYGLSEATPIISTNTYGKKQHRFGSSGQLIQPLDLRILDDEGRELGVGQKGEIVIKGENVMAGYWKNPDSTADTVRDGWLYTGDMGYMSADDFLYVLGRFKSLLISSDGEKYSPEGMEEAIVDKSPFIDQVIVYNNQNPYTIALVVGSKEALNRRLDEEQLTGDERYVRAAEILGSEVAKYRTGGIYGDEFPDRWVPAVVALADEAFTEQNGLVNSTMKVVRNKVEKHFSEAIAHAYTPEGKSISNERNIMALKKLLG